MVEIPRRTQREGLTVDQRLNFLEDDADRSDKQQADTIEAVRLVGNETKALVVKLLFAVITLCFTIIGGIAVAVFTK